MELTQFDVVSPANEGVWMNLEHPVTGEPLEVKIKLAGIDSDYYKKELRRQQNKRFKKGFRKMNAEELESETIELLVACTLDWDGVELEGQALECNPENVRKVYKQFPWIKEQVDNFINDRANFLKN